MRKKYLVSGITIALAGLFLWAVWPTMYRYEHTELLTELGKTKVLVRINRFSNETEALLDNNGWTRLARRPSLDEIFNKEPKLVTDPKILAQLNGRQSPMSSATVPELPPGQ